MHIDQNTLPLFCRTWWAEAVCPGQCTLLHAADEAGNAAVWPICIERKFGLQIARTPPLTPYWGPTAIKGNLSAACLEDLRKQIKRKAFFQSTSYPQATFAATHLAAHGFTVKEKVTHLLALEEPEAALEANIHPKRRNAIRKALQDLQVHRSIGDIEMLAKHQSIAFTEKGKRYPFSANFLRRVIDKAEEQNASFGYHATDAAGNVQAQIWLACDHDTVYYLLSATPEKTHRGAVSLLLWEAIKDAKRAGFTTFDFEGSMDPGIAHFFARFGGTRTPYFEFTAKPSLIWRLKTKLLS